jgi:hypothetical protein
VFSFIVPDRPSPSALSLPAGSVPTAFSIPTGGGRLIGHVPPKLDVHVPEIVQPSVMYKHRMESL